MKLKKYFLTGDYKDKYKHLIGKYYITIVICTIVIY